MRKKIDLNKNLKDIFKPYTNEAYVKKYSKVLEVPYRDKIVIITVSNYIESIIYLNNQLCN